MDNERDLSNSRNNAMYYNQMLREDRVKRGSNNKKQNSAPITFSSQKVDISDYIFVPEGYEGLFYTIYFFSIPYLIGAVFLFFFVAGGDYDNFMLLDKSAILVVWMIGYEIVATLLLISIFISFLRYDKKPKRRY